MNLKLNVTQMVEYLLVGGKYYKKLASNVQMEDGRMVRMIEQMTET